MIKNFNWNLLSETRNKEITLLDDILNIRKLSIDNIFACKEHSPFLMKDMQNVVDLIIKGIRRNDKIMIAGDYDCDGVNSTISLYDFLKNKLSVRCDYIIPDRLNDGYGLSFKIADYIIDNNYDMVVTVDNGISCHEVIDYLKFNNIKVIVTDHHEQKETLPSADAIIDPKRNDETYPFKELAGVGVVLKLIQAICETLEYPNTFYEEYYLYAMLGTIADVMSVQNENKIIINKGLNYIKNNNITFIDAICSVLNKDKTNLVSSDIGFLIAPRINTASRMGNIQLILNLYESKDFQTALNYAKQLELLNNNRKNTVDYIFNSAVTIINNSSINLSDAAPIIVSSKGWHKGVLGIVSSKLVDLYSRPAFVFTEDENGVCHGSVRTYNHINLIPIIESVKDLLISFGGHKEACGLSLNKKNMKEFYEKIIDYCNKNIDINLLVPYLSADIVTDLSDMSIDNALDINSLEPFGHMNEKPKFMIQKVKILDINIIGKDKSHLKLNLEQNGITINAIAFSKVDYIDLLYKGMTIDILCTLDINEWNNKKNPQLIIEDIHFNIYSDCEISLDEELMYDENLISIQDLIEECDVSIEKVSPSKNEYNIIYKSIISMLKDKNTTYYVTDIFTLSGLLMSKANIELNIFKLMRILESLNEANYLIFKKLINGMVIISLNQRTMQKLSVSETKSYIKCHDIFSNN